MRPIEEIKKVNKRLEQMECAEARDMEMDAIAFRIAHSITTNCCIYYMARENNPLLARVYYYAYINEQKR